MLHIGTGEGFPPSNPHSGALNRAAWSRPCRQTPPTKPPGSRSAARPPSWPAGKPPPPQPAYPSRQLVRRALGRVRTWTAGRVDVEQARTRELARIGSNLNQLARWANTHKAGLDAVTIITHLTALSGELAAFSAAEIPREADDAH